MVYLFETAGGEQIWGDVTLVERRQRHHAAGFWQS